MRFFKYYLLSAAIVICCIANAQVKTKFNNPEKLTEKGKFNKDYKITIDFELPAKDIKDLLNKETKEQNALDETKPLRIAEPVPVNINIVSQMKWTTDNLFTYGKYTIKAKGALSTSINFDKFYLPEGSELYVYNDNGEMITGPVTDAENNKAMKWGSWVYKGEFLNIEIKTPLELKDELVLHANNIAYGYKAIYKVGNFGQSGTCNVNVLCPLGNGWEGERNSVALTLDGNGGRLCSGSMIMNTCNTDQPFFLTANHCFEGDGNVGGWRFTFQAWSPNCTPSQNSDGVTFNGSVLRARNAASDFCLVELNNIPPANSNIHYAGWNRDATPATQATGIHHPQGDVMKISRADNAVMVGSFAATTNQHWRADWSPQNNGAGQTVTPVTEPTSSGSPLFDQNHRIIGQLHGGPSACGGTQLWDFYGRFDLSWTGGGTDATRLSNWLDPTNSGAFTTNTTNISLLTNSGTYYIAGDNTVCATSNDYIITGLPAGANVQWQASPLGIVTINSPNSTQTTLTKNSSGNITLTAFITNACGGPTTVTKEVRVGGYSSSDYQISGPSTACNNQEVYFSTNPTLIGATGYAWFWPSDWTYIAGNNSNYLTLRTGTSSGVVGVSVANACDAGGSPATKYVQINNCGFGFSASPNPTNNILTVQAVDGKGQPSTDPTQKFYELQITDKSGVIKKQFKYAGGLQQTNINLSTLPANLYFLRVWDGKAWTSLQIFKQ